MAQNSNPSSFLMMQGRRNARTEQINKFEDGLAEFIVTRDLFIGRRSSILAPEDFLREKEAHLKDHYQFLRTEKTLRL